MGSVPCSLVKNNPQQNELHVVEPVPSVSMDEHEQHETAVDDMTSDDNVAIGHARH